MRAGPSEPAVQEQVPNHLRRLWSKAMVVSAEGKGLGRTGQVTGKKRTAREPLMTCRKRRDDVKTAGESLLRDELRRKPVYGPEWHPALRWPELARGD